MDVRDKKNQIRASELAVIRAIRTAALVLSDAAGDLNAVDSLIPDEAEVVEARSAAWSVVKPLLSELERNVRAFSNDSILSFLSDTIEKCNRLLEAYREEVANLELEKFRQQFDVATATIPNSAGEPNHAK